MENTISSQFAGGFGLPVENNNRKSADTMSTEDQHVSDASISQAASEEITYQTLLLVGN